MLFVIKRLRVSQKHNPPRVTDMRDNNLSLAARLATVLARSKSVVVSEHIH
jgi:hypothetical protein